MKKLTEEKCHEMIGSLVYAQVSGGISTKEELYLQALQIALESMAYVPEYYIHRVEVCDSYGPDFELRAFNNALDASKCKDDHGGEIIKLYTLHMEAN